MAAAFKVKTNDPVEIVVTRTLVAVASLPNTDDVTTESAAQRAFVIVMVLPPTSNQTRPATVSAVTFPTVELVLTFFETFSERHG